MAAAGENQPTPASGVSFVGAIGEKTFRGIGNLIKLLPTGTVFLFQFLNPILTNNGNCTTLNQVFTGILLSVCTFSCCFSCFTDSYTGIDGKLYYGLVTTRGIWPFWDPNPLQEDTNKKCKLRLGDFVHAFYSVVVFAVIGLLDSNTVKCFYPGFEASEKVLLMVLPPVVGGLSSFIFMVFPNTRHGIGYPSSPANNKDNN